MICCGTETTIRVLRSSEGDKYCSTCDECNKKELINGREVEKLLASNGVLQEVPEQRA